MELSEKQKTVQVIGAAESALARLEENIRAVEARGKTPPKEDKQLLKSIYRALNTLKRTPFAGENIPYKLWPRELAELPNLFRMELSQFWRLLYYVAGDEVQVVSVVFEIANHEKYNKIFGYRNK